MAPIKNNSELFYMILTSSNRRGAFLVCAVSNVHLHYQNILKKYKIGSFLSKCINKPFTLRTPLTLEHLKKVVRHIQKNSAKSFAASIHQNHEHERPIQSVKSNVINVYDRFFPQSFE